MPEEGTRKLLKLFGVAVTGCDDAVQELRAIAHRDPAAPPEALVAAYAAYAKAARDLSARSAEVNRLIADHQASAEQAIEAYLRVHAGA